MPEEERLVSEESTINNNSIDDDGESDRTPTLFPSNRQKQTLHITTNKAHIGRSGQVTTQAIHLCASRSVAVQWMTFGGKFAAGTASSPGRVQQRIRQYAALNDETIRLRLAKTLVHAKVEMQLKYLLRATRGNDSARTSVSEQIERIRRSLIGVERAENAASLLGLEGMAAKAYFATLPSLLVDQVPLPLIPQGRTKHPPKDRFNALLSFGRRASKG